MRRRFKSNTELTKTTGDIARNRRFQKPSETRKAKRVRFDDAKTDDFAGGHEATQSPRCDAPKTSEYAYFRKVKDGAANGQFRARQKENSPSKSSKIDYLLTEAYKASEMLGLSTGNLNFSISGESAGPSGHNHFASPPVNKYGEPHEIKTKELSRKTNTRSQLLTEIVTPVRQSLATPLLNHATEKSENHCTEKGVFSEKRKRLRQWVAHTTSSEVENLHRKRSEVVALLLSRLIPKATKNNDSSKADADNSSGSLTIHESDNLEKGLLPLSDKTDCDKYLSNTSSGRSSEIILKEKESFSPGFPSNYRKECDLQNKTIEHSGRSSEIILRERESFDSGFLYNQHSQIDLQNETMDCDQHSASRISKSSETQHGFSFSLPFERFRSLGAFHFKDLDEFSPIVRHGREEPYQHSLEMDFELGRDTRANVWNIDQQRILDNMLDIKGFSPSPLYSRRHLSKPLPNYVSTGYSVLEIEPNLDDVKYETAEPRHLSLTFPTSPKCITFGEEENAENIISSSNNNLIFSYSDPKWPKKNILDCNPRSGFWWECLSAPEFSDHPSTFRAWKFPQNENGLNSLSLVKEASPEPFTSFYKGAFDHFLLNSTLHSPIDAFMNCPLLLNHVSQDNIFDDQELCSDDYNEFGF